MSAMAKATAAAGAALPAADTLALAYEAVERLHNNSPDSQEAYSFLLDCVKVAGVQQLVAQYIPRYYNKFPALKERAYNAQIDLCEDENPVNIRCHAIQGIAVLCRSDPECVTRMAAVLAQLLDSEDHLELQTVKRSLNTLLEVDTAATLFSIFHQATSYADSTMRKRMLEVFQTMLTASGKKALLAKDQAFQDKLAARCVAQVKELMVDEKDTRNILSFFTGLPHLDSAEFAQALYDAMCSVCLAGSDVSEAAGLEQLARGLSAASPLVGDRHAKLGEGLAALFAQKVLPAVASTARTPAAPSAAALFTALKHLVLASNSIPPELAAILVTPTVNALQSCVAVDDAADAADAAAGDDAATATATAAASTLRVNYSFAECLLHVLHHCGAAQPDETKKLCLPAGEGNTGSIRSELEQLQKSARLHSAKVAIKLKAAKDSDAEAVSKRNKTETALKTVRTIDTLINSLLKKNPTFSKSSQASWGHAAAGRAAAHVAKKAGAPDAKSLLKQQLLASRETPSPANGQRTRAREFGSPNPPPPAAKPTSAGQPITEAQPSATTAEQPTERRKREGIKWRTQSSKRAKTEVVVGVPATKEEKEQRIAAAKARAEQEREKHKEIMAQNSTRYLPPARRGTGAPKAAPAAAAEAAGEKRKGRGTFGKRFHARF